MKLKHHEALSDEQLLAASSLHLLRKRYAALRDHHVEESKAMLALLAHVRHASNCDALGVMWNKGPCDCGLSALLRELPTALRKRLGPGAVICTTCGDKKNIEDGPCPCSPEHR